MGKLKNQKNMSSSIPVCDQCFSKDIVIDAYAKWNPDKGEWIMDRSFIDEVFCNSFRYFGERTNILWLDENDPKIK